MPSTERAFLGTLDDLRARCGFTASEYDVIQAAGLIRRLLADDKSLLDQVLARRRRRDTEARGKRAHAARPIFHWTEFLQPLDYGRPDHERRNVMFVTGYQIDPALGASGLITPRHGTAAEFLAVGVVMRLMEPGMGGVSVVSVKDLIRHYANRMGGVHFDPDAPPEKPLLLEAIEFSEVAMEMTVAAVARIVVRALEPIAIQIVASEFPLRWQRGRIARPAAVDNG